MRLSTMMRTATGTRIKSVAHHNAHHGGGGRLELLPDTKLSLDGASRVAADKMLGAMEAAVPAGGGETGMVKGVLCGTPPHPPQIREDSMVLVTISGVPERMPELK